MPWQPVRKFWHGAIGREEMKITIAWSELGPKRSWNAARTQTDMAYRSRGYF